MKFNIAPIKAFAKDGIKFIEAHAPEILTGIGVGGFVATTVVAVHVTPKAIENIDNERIARKHQIIEELGENVDPEIKELRVADAMKLTPFDYIRVTWRQYLPVIIMGGASATCVLGANHINLKRNAALAAAYVMTETRFDEYKDKVKAVIGEKKEQTVRDEIAKDRIVNNPPREEDIISTGRGETLCYDAISGRYFYSDIDEIKRCINLLNHQLLYDEAATLNDLYDYLGLEPNKAGEDFGWNVNRTGLVEPNFTSDLTDKGIPCVVLDFIEGPFYTGYSALVSGYSA